MPELHLLFRAFRGLFRVARVDPLNRGPSCQFLLNIENLHVQLGGLLGIPAIQRIVAFSEQLLEVFICAHRNPCGRRVCDILWLCGL